MAEEIIVLDAENKIWFLTFLNEGEGTIMGLHQIPGGPIKAHPGGVKISSIKRGSKSLSIAAKSIAKGNNIYVWKTKLKEETLKCTVLLAYIKFV